MKNLLIKYLLTEKLWTSILNRTILNNFLNKIKIITFKMKLIRSIFSKADKKLIKLYRYHNDKNTRANWKSTNKLKVTIKICPMMNLFRLQGLIMKENNLK